MKKRVIAPSRLELLRRECDQVIAVLEKIKRASTYDEVEKLLEELDGLI